jgi:predicted DNA-binding transcriptional regulator YafY
MEGESSRRMKALRRRRWMWHASQEIVPLKPDGSVIEFRARLSGLEEITRWVLSWGSKAQVMGPAALKKRVQKEVAAMVKNQS